MTMVTLISGAPPQLLSWLASPVGASLAAGSAVAFLGLLLWLTRIALRQAGRERQLEEAVRVRTEELERERLRERAYNGILEQLVSNQPLGAVLDSIARQVRDETNNCRCAVLLKRSSGWHVGAAPGIAPDWVSALRLPQALPFKVWRRDCSWPDVATEAAWGIFLAALSPPRPRAIHSRVIGSGESQMGAVLVFETAEPDVDASRLQAAMQAAVRLAFVAIEHGNFYEGLSHQAHHDTLTGLPNRVLFEDRLAVAIQEAATARQFMSVISIDIDHFKRINDSISHSAGDVILTQIGSRIRRAIRAFDTVARIGGDEFNVILAGVSSPEDADEISQLVLEAIRQPMLVEGKPVSPTASLGCSMFPADGSDSEDLRRKANAALTCAKNLGRNRVQMFGARIDALDRVRLEHEIRQALEQNWFTVHYQPKIDAGGAFCGLEALLRLTSPTLGPIAPAAFIPVAEESGLIMPLGAWVLSEACRQMSDWHRRGMGWVPVAVNVSPAQISQPGFAREVLDCLHSYGVPPQSLELELTESIVLGGGEEGERHMRELRSIGIRFSIDDFGTGYSSLSYLYRLPVDAIKLDRSFVQAIDKDQAARRLVQAMIGVAEGLGLNVVAEGVETEEQRGALIAAGCLVMQGYLFARPAPACEIERFIRRISAGPTVPPSNLDDSILIDRALTNTHPPAV